MTDTDTQKASKSLIYFSNIRIDLQSKPCLIFLSSHILSFVFVNEYTHQKSCVNYKKECI